MNHQQPLTIAIIGCGAVAQLYYAGALQELARGEQLRVGVLYDPSPASLAEMQRQFPQARGLSSFDALADHAIDLAIVASPPRFHAEQAAALLRRGVAVLCEKPMAASVADAEAMVEAAAASGAPLAIGLYRRFLPATQAIRRILDQGMLGEITRFSISEGGAFRWPVQSPAYFHKASVNGLLMDIGVHALDLLTWWMGRPAAVRYADDAMGGIEANCLLQCDFAGGATGQVRLSRDCELPNRYSFYGTKGWLRWDVDETAGLQLGLAGGALGLKAAVHTLDLGQPEPALGPRGHSFHQSFLAQLRNVVAAVRGDEPLFIPGEQGLPSLRLIAECYRRRTLMPMPWLSERELAAAASLNGAR